MNQILKEQKVKENTVIVDKSISDLTEVNELLETTIKEIKNNQPLTHFSNEFILQRQLNIVEQMKNALNLYLKVFEKEQSIEEDKLVDFKYEMQRITNNYFYLEHYLKK